MRPVFAHIATLSVALLASSAAQAVALYDGALGTEPTAQGLTFFAFPAGSYTSTAAGATTLDTSSSLAISGGYTNGSPLTLDRAAGYTVRVDAKILSSVASNPDRAGFSIIALSTDKIGIEIGFHGNEVFSQQGGTAPNLFTRGQAASFDTTAAVKRYDLTIAGSTYTLRADGTPILTGPLQDYTAFAGFPDVYETPNFLFLGDDSTSAGGSTQFSYVGVTVPEPATLGLMAGAVALIARRRQ
jgi:hypothetical protein